MIRRLSGSFLIRAVILAMAACIVGLLAISSWQSWTKLTATARIAMISDASGNAFKAMHHLRTDRAVTQLSLVSEGPIDPGRDKQLRQARGIQMPALAGAAATLAQLEFDGKAALLPELNQLTATLAKLHPEFWEAMSQPKAARRPMLAKDIGDTANALTQTLDKISASLAAEVRHSDPAVDQLLSIKQIAWQLRHVAGEASILVAGGMASGKLPPDARQIYLKHLGGIDATWNTLQGAMSGISPGSALDNAMQAAKTAYFDAPYVALRDRLFAAVEKGEKPEMAQVQWSPMTVERMASAVTIAERALQDAKERGEKLYSDALRDLVTGLAFLALAIGFAAFSAITVNRRIIVPLHIIRDAMGKVADGDLAIEVPYAERSDEIGALAHALGTFRQNAIDKARIEDEQRGRQQQNAVRQRAIESHIAAFESEVTETLDTLASASDQMRRTSDEMSAISNRTNTQVRTAVRASSNASASVSSVAAAAEELSASIGDISRQVTHAAAIAGRANAQARQTDSTVQSLAESASRIGDVVKLINAVAGQTNLLALNATIEAARAGEAGKGFAVVASEVKSLANQTAKATDEISLQINTVQSVAQEAMLAIKGIAGTIAEVSDVATAIASAVDQQGAATIEITRSTQRASQSTNDVSDNITGVSSDADATGLSADNVKSAADVLGMRASDLRNQVNTFLEKIRAA